MASIESFGSTSRVIVLPVSVFTNICIADAVITLAEKATDTSVTAIKTFKAFFIKTSKKFSTSMISYYRKKVKKKSFYPKLIWDRRIIIYS